MRTNALDRFIQSVAKEAGNSIRNNFGKVTVGTEKTGQHDIVTAADYEAEDIIIKAIRQKYPYHSILAEESGELPGRSEYTWIIDPLDGTSNFAKQIPLFCTIIALAKGNTIEASAMYDPIHDQMYYARRGVGAYLNGKRIHVSKETNLSNTIMQISNVRHRSSLETFAHWRSLFALHTTYFKSFGSAGITLSSLSSGKIDAYITGGPYPWDIAAGALLLREAGGRITTIEGKRWNWREPNQHILAANPALHKKILKLITQR